MKKSAFISIFLALAVLLCLPVCAEAADYSDVPAGAWCYGEVCRMRELGLMIGTSADCFSPNAEVTRGMAVTVLHRYAGCPAPEQSGSAVFTDVGKGSYCDEAVGWAFENGITLGYDAEHFKPNQTVTRQQLVTFLHRYAESIGAEPTILPDIGWESEDWDEVADYARRSMKWASIRGILRGTDDDHYSPNATATRAQFAVFMTRYIDYMALIRVTRIDPPRYAGAEPSTVVMSRYDSERFPDCIRQFEVTETQELSFHRGASIRFENKTYYFGFSYVDPVYWDTMDHLSTTDFYSSNPIAVISDIGYEGDDGGCGLLSTEDAELTEQLTYFVAYYAFADLYEIN